MSAPTDELRLITSNHYTTVSDWVLLAPKLSDRAFRVYALLRMHLQEGPKVWPGQKTLAAMLGIKKTDGIGAAITELRELGAVTVEVERHPGGRRNIYYIHEAVPEGYNDGPISRSDFYSQRGDDPGIGGDPLNGDDPGIGGEGDPGNGGDGSPPKRGSEVTQEEVNKEVVTSTPSEADASAAQHEPPTDEADPDGEHLLASEAAFDQPPANGTSEQGQSRNGSAANVTQLPKRLPQVPPQGAAPPSVSAGDVVKAWVDAFVEVRPDGVKSTGSQRSRVGRAAKELLADGNDPQRVLAAAKQAGAGGYVQVDTELAKMTGPPRSSQRNGYKPYGEPDRADAERIYAQGIS